MKNWQWADIVILKKTIKTFKRRVFESKWIEMKSWGHVMKLGILICVRYIPMRKTVELFQAFVNFVWKLKLIQHPQDFWFCSEMNIVGCLCDFDELSSASLSALLVSLLRQLNIIIISVRELFLQELSNMHFGEI